WILWRFVPTYGPAVLIRFHLLTYFLFLSFISLEEIFTYSGYTTLPSLILGSIARRQDLHMASYGQGNFAPWGFLDWLHGTSVGGDVMKSIKDEMEKNSVTEKARNARTNTKGQGRKGLKRKTKF